MDITPLYNKGQNIIHGYGDGGFTIGKTRIEGSILLFPDCIVNLGDFSKDNLHQVIDKYIHLFQEKNTEIVLLGLGEAHHHISKDAIRVLAGNSIAYDSMQTSAACRTYNILLSEDRVLAALLMAV